MRYILALILVFNTLPGLAQNCGNVSLRYNLYFESKQFAPISWRLSFIRTKGKTLTAGLTNLNNGNQFTLIIPRRCKKLYFPIPVVADLNFDGFSSTVDYDCEVIIKQNRVLTGRCEASKLVELPTGKLIEFYDTAIIDGYPN